MKKLSIVPSLLLLATLNIYSQKKPDVATLFRNIVTKVDKNFKKSPMVLTSQDYPASASGLIYYKLQFEELDLSYDVQKTNSLVSPYIGYIMLKLRVTSNEKSGDVKGYNDNIGFVDSTNAKQSNNFESCSDRTYDINQWCVGEIKINYSYQNNKWIFKSIDTETENRIANGTTRGDIERGIIDNLFKK